ncbi:energy-coupling factor ABC transporter ATP-binding protein [Paenibacillus piri]|uniref:ABC transporter ATP-binding protein n=1 Tax=Paenibacillus piri TaxID=2547395 RepID=A0A4R5KG47_9BACL|nr:ABC transporter ATP-binding protein [Paenibacillus piri]TDF93190.1 ABC transporter ATP-binding protein [Paenibacillus piri]
MKSIMEALEVNYQYPGSAADALNGLTMSIPEGKRTAICGHNGSGKSTFFLHAVGIHRPAAGLLTWKGTPLSYDRKQLQLLRQRVGLVFQDPEQQLILNTPFEDISYGLRNARVPEDEIRVRTLHILDSMGLGQLADTPLHHLSLGQKKRVALAGVLVLRPELLLLDEPTAYLDRSSERQLLEELSRIHESGITVVMATHDMNLAYAWADWVLVMDRGQCVMQGPPEEVFRDEARLQALGLELPLLLELWQALPEAMRNGVAPPRSVEELKRVALQFHYSC